MTEEQKREHHLKVTQTRIHRETANMTRQHMIVKFSKGTFSLSQLSTVDDMRRAMRRTMALYHPDKTMHAPWEEQVESEVIYSLLQTHYESLDKMCKK